MTGARIRRGVGGSNVASGVPVLDHLLELLATAGRFELTLEVDPDDPEAEVGAAGTALGVALAPLMRPGNHGTGVVPKDEALAMVVVEASGRPAVVTNVDFSPSRIGGLDTDLAARFLDGLAEAAGLTVHVRLLEGSDTAHVLDAIFKALGVALNLAAHDGKDS